LRLRDAIRRRQDQAHAKDLALRPGNEGARLGLSLLGDGFGEWFHAACGFLGRCGIGSSGRCLSVGAYVSEEGHGGGSCRRSVLMFPTLLRFALSGRVGRRLALWEERHGPSNRAPGGEGAPLQRLCPLRGERHAKIRGDALGGLREKGPERLSDEAQTLSEVPQHMIEPLARVPIAATLSPRQRPGFRVLDEPVSGPYQVEDRFKTYGRIPSLAEAPVQRSG